jgi:hypothetical protein
MDSGYLYPFTVTRHLGRIAGAAKLSSPTSATKFYHWGGLTGVIGLIEDGLF